MFGKCGFTRFCAMLTAACLAAPAPSAFGFETIGSLFEFDASQDAGGDATWTETGLFGFETLTFVGGATPTAGQVSDGTLNLFAHTVGADGLSNAYDQTLGGVGQASRRNATFEVWFKPNDLSTADQIIQETGGAGRGTIISLDGNNLEFLANGNASTSISTTLANTDWHQVVGVVNVTNNNSADDFISLYLNGAFIGDTSGTLTNIDDWAGGNQGGLGSFGGATHPIDGQVPGNDTGDDFNGALHLYRYYDQALTGTQVLANYNAVVAPAASWNVDGNGLWGTGGNWTGGVSPGVGTPGEDAILGSAISAPRTVTLNVNTNLGGLQLADADGYTVAAGGGTLTLSGNAELRVSQGAHEIAAPIAGSAGLTKTGTGTVALSGSNTYTGANTISSGTLAVSSNANLGNAVNGVVFDGGVLRIDGTTFNTLSRSLTLNSGATLNVSDSANTVDVTSSLTGSNNFVKSGDGAAKLSNAAGFNGDIFVNGGALVVDSAGGLGTGSGDTQVGQDGGTVEIDGSGGALTITENFNRLLSRFNGVQEAHIRNTAGNNTITGTIEAGGGEFGNARFENTAEGTTLTLDTPLTYTVENDFFTFQFRGTGDFQIGDAATPGSGSIRGNNVNVVVALDDPTDQVTIATAVDSLDTSNATGSKWGNNTTIESGTLAVLQDGSNDGELASRTIDVQSGGTFDISDFSAYSLQVVEDPDQVPFNGDEIGQTLSGGGTVNAGTGTLQVFEDAVIAPGDSTGTLNVTGNLSINQTQANPNGALNYELGNTNTVGSGVNDLIDVSNTLTLNASGTGAYTLNVVPVEGSLAAGPYTIMSAGTLTGTANAGDFNVSLQDADGNTFNTRQDDSIVVNVDTVSDTVTVSFSPAQTGAWVGGVNNTWDVGTTANWSTTDGRLFDLDTATFGDGTGQTTVNIAGPVTPGGVVFNNTVDTYTLTGGEIQGAGSIDLNAGARVVVTQSNAAAEVNIASTARLTVGDGVSNTGSIAAGTAVNNSGTLEFNRTGYGFVTPSISGTGGVEVSNGFVDLNGVSTYSGGSTVNKGTLRLRNASAGGTGSFTVNNNSGLELGYFANQTINQAVTLNNGSRLAATSPSDDFVPLASRGNVTWAGAITLGGTGGAVSTNSGNGVNPGLIVTGGIGGTGDLTLLAETDRLLVVNSSISHSGNTTIDGGGTVALQGAASLNSAVVNVRDNTTVDVTAAGGTLALSGQTFDAAGRVAGNVTTAASSTVRVGGVAGGTPSVTTGLQLNYDASLDQTGDGLWTESSGVGDVNLSFSGGVASTVPVNDVSFPGITAAYDIGSAGAALPPGSENGFFDFRGTNSGTFEIVFNVTDTNAGNEQVLLDISATRGISLTLDGSTLNAGVNGNASVTTAAFTTLSTGWHHAVVVINDVDPNSTSLDDTFSLYVNDMLIGGGQMAQIDDYAGGNGWAVGGANSSVLDPTPATEQALANPIDFHGEIAAARYYQTAFSSSDVSANFAALQNGPFIDVATLAVDGDLTLDPTATLELDIFDAVLGSDLVDVEGALTAAGVLDISVAGTVALGETFDLLDFGSASGSFSSISVSGLGGGLALDTSALLTTGIVEVISASANGDFDFDGDVDVADLLLWQRGGSPNPFSPADLALWESSFTGGSVSAVGAVPEPASAAMLLSGIAGLALRRRRSSRRNDGLA
ncbi:MAG: autotransporter-associated beta strand repeat-containing protein [Planctomycetota bacterium]